MTIERVGPIVDSQTNAQNADLDVVLKRYRKGTYFVPPYQRDADEWDDTKKSLFIESILNRLTVPAFYMAESEQDPGRSEIVDGQQRMTTLSAFFHDGFRLLTDDRCPYFGEHSVHYAGKTHEELGEQWKDAFGNYVLNLVVLPKGMDLALRLEIFRRINEGGTPLSGQDIRLSYYSQAPAVRFIQLVGIYDKSRTGSTRMLDAAKELFPWPWDSCSQGDIDTWQHWWEETRTSSGQTASEMFLWYVVSKNRKQVDHILDNKKHLRDNLRLTFRNRGEEVLDIVCAQLEHEHRLEATGKDVPKLLPDVNDLRGKHFCEFSTWVIAMRQMCTQQVSVNRNHYVALLIPGLVECFGEDPSFLKDYHWGWIGRFISRTRETAAKLSVDFPEAKGRWGGARGQRAQMESFFGVAKAIASRSD